MPGEERNSMKLKCGGWRIYDHGYEVLTEHKAQLALGFWLYPDGWKDPEGEVGSKSWGMQGAAV